MRAPQRCPSRLSSSIPWVQAMVTITAPADASCSSTALPPGVHVLGPIPLDHMVASVASGTMTFEPELEVATQSHWEAALLARPKMFDGPVWCVRSFEVRPRGCGARELQLRLQLSSFKYVLYTHFSDEGKRLPADKRCGACGLMAITETSDGALLLGQRSQAVGSMPGYWHFVPAGHVDTTEFGTVLKEELLEETGVGWENVVSANLMALLDTGAEQGHKFEFTFYLKLSLTAAEVLERYRLAEDRGEHEAIAFVRLPGSSLTGTLPPAVPEVSFDDFLSDGRFVITEVARRALLVLKELRRASA